MSNTTRKIPHRHEIHGDVREDDYFWMRERDSAPVIEYLERENRRTAEALKPVAALEAKLYQEMRSRIKEEDQTVPVPNSGFFYYARFEKGQEYPLHCRKAGSLEAAEEIYLDENVLAKGHSYYDVEELQVSPNQNILAYAADTRGRRIYDIHFKDLKSGRTLPDKIEAVTPNFAWAADNKTLFYVRQDPETLRPYQVFRYELGSTAPEMIYEETDTTFGVNLVSTKRNSFIFMAITKRDSTEWRILDARNLRAAWEIFWPREDQHEYSLVDGGDRFYVLTNWQATNQRLMEAPFQARHKNEWKEIVAHNPKIFRTEVDAYAAFLVISERENGLTQIRLRDRATGTERVLQFPDPTYEVTVLSLPEYQSPSTRFLYESLVRPPSVFEEEFKTGARTLKKMREVPGYNPDLYESRRLWATAPDGVQVPISLVMKKGLPLNGKNPTLLYGYGSYGLTTEVYFHSAALSLVDRGFVYALAHIRGGSEMGREWYEEGRLMRKMNTFTDFIACGKKLIADGLTSAEHLYAMGGSAGGLLMGAVMNMRPDLFNGLLAAVPFVDVLTTMLDETLPLTTGEYREWGDPRVREEYMYMKKYSPYDNVEAKNYPHLLVTTGYHDSQVQYWEPAKWVARLREMKTDANLLLLYTEMEAGHSGTTGRFEALKTAAKEYVFLLMLEGMKE